MGNARTSFAWIKLKMPWAASSGLPITRSLALPINLCQSVLNSAASGVCEVGSRGRGSYVTPEPLRCTSWSSSKTPRRLALPRSRMYKPHSSGTLRDTVRMAALAHDIGMSSSTDDVVFPVRKTMTGS